METTTNLKRRRDSGEGAAKKVRAGPSCTEDPLEGPSNAHHQKQPLPQQVSMQIPLLAPFPPLSLPPPPLPLPTMFPPQYCIPQNAPSESLQPPQYLQPPLPPPQPPQPPLPTETPPLHPRRHQIVHIRRAQSLERPSPPKITQVTLITIPESNLFPRTLSRTDSHPNKPPDYIISTSKRGGKRCRERTTTKSKTFMHRWCRSSNGPSIKKDVKAVTATGKSGKKKK